MLNTNLLGMVLLGGFKLSIANYGFHTVSSFIRYPTQKLKVLKTLSEAFGYSKRGFL